MNKRVALRDMSPLMEEMLAAGREVVLTATGDSMRPMLRNRQDQICLIRATRKNLVKYALTLYRRQNGQFVLHRIIKVKDNEFIMRGDNQYVKEIGIERAQMIGIVSAFYRDGRCISTSDIWYKIYTRIWVNTIVLRKGLSFCIRFIKGIKQT